MTPAPILAALLAVSLAALLALVYLYDRATDALHAEQQARLAAEQAASDARALADSLAAELARVSAPAIGRYRTDGSPDATASVLTRPMPREPLPSLERMKALLSPRGRASASDDARRIAGEHSNAGRVAVGRRD